MSSITAITRPLPGERVLDLSPEQEAVAAATTWRRRPNLFPGRALTAATLDARSAWLAGRVATRGQAFTPGIVSGLQVEYRLVPAPVNTDPPGVRLQIAAGQGLAVFGETLMVGEMETDLYSLQVVAPPDVLDGGGFGAGGILQPRVISELTLGELLTSHPGALPHVGVLVLQPVSTQRADQDEGDPCDRCGCDDAVNYEDWRRADAVRLLWYAWPVDWAGPLPAWNDLQLRNRVAFRIFDAERRLAPDEVLPWESYGVPVAVMGVDTRFTPRFTDHAAVARRGGRGRFSHLQLRADTAPGGLLALDSHWRLPMLWQSQIEQLAEQVASEYLHAEQQGGPAPSSKQLARLFDRLPPCGVLPVDAIDLDTGHSAFFPAAMDLDAIPIPLEQLDLAIRESAGLAPLDIARGERVRLLVPVSQASYEPRLLLSETIDPEFQITLDRFLLARSDALAARQGTRLKADVLVRALKGPLLAPAVPAIGDDPLALEPEVPAMAAWGPAPGTCGHRSQLREGIHEHGFDNLTLALTSANLLYTWVYIDPDAIPDTLMLEWRGAGTARAYWGENRIERGTDGTTTRMLIGPMPEPGRWTRLLVPAALLGLGDPGNNTGAVTGMSFVLSGGRAAFGGSGKITNGDAVPWFDLTSLGSAQFVGDEPFDLLSQADLLAPLEPHNGVVAAPGASAGVAEAFTLLSGNSHLADVLSDAELSQLPLRGVEGFIDFLKTRADRADDIVDYGFVKVQTDLYRVRQIMLGTTEATRLAISPALANIAQAETAVATHDRINDFIKRTKIAEAASTIPLARATTLRSSAAPAESASLFMMRAEVTETASATTKPTVTSGLRDSGLLGLATSVESSFQTKGSLFDSGLLAAAATSFDFGAVFEPTHIAPTGATPTYTKSDVTGATPLSGNINLRTISLADRLKLPESQRARDYSTLTRHEALQSLVNLADELIAQDGMTPGLFEQIDVWGLAGDSFLADLQPAQPAATSGTTTRPVLKRSFADFIDPARRGELFGKLLSVPERTQADEGAFFSDSADMADRTIALFRQVEGRIRSYRQVIAICEATRGVLGSQLAATHTREVAISERLAEARHDVSVTRALIAEEQQRIDAINQRRRDVIEREVRFIAYVRPRDTDNLLAAPMRVLDPGLLESPAPACLEEHADVPEELHELLAVVREAPAAWFVHGAPLLDLLDRTDLLLRTVRTAQVRSLVAPQRLALAQELGNAGNTTGRFFASIAKVRTMQARVVQEVRATSQRLDVVRLATLNWQSVRVEAARVISFGDLIDGDHGRGLLSRRAAAEFDRIGHICGCLHAAFSGVLPSIRLDWAEVLSQFDDAPSLRNLSVLARWGEIPYIDRRRMQGLVDWLFDQIGAGEPRAFALVNDLVRMCLLLASHAPVGRIIAGRLPRPVTARPGVRIPLVALDPSRLRIGMHALVYHNDSVVTRAVVEDIGGGEVFARVLQTAAPSVELDGAMRVQFAQASSISLAPMATRAMRVG